MKVRVGVPDDTEAIVDLMRRSLGEGSVPRSVAFFRWKHVECPFGPSPVLLAEDEGQLVGLRAFLRWELQRGNTRYRAVRAVDTATHPEFRGRGIFKRLTLELVERMREEGIDFVFNTPNEKSGPGYKKMGWVEVGTIPVWLRPGIGWPRRTLGMSWGAIRAREREALLASTTSEQPAQWARGDFGERAHTPRTRTYLRWRYVDVPGIEYGALYAPSRHLIVFRRRVRHRLREATVCELIVAPSLRARLSAIAALTSLGLDAEVVTMSASAAHGMNALLRASGSLKLSGPTLMSRELRSPPIEGFRRWGWSLGDLELF